MLHNWSRATSNVCVAVCLCALYDCRLCIVSRSRFDSALDHYQKYICLVGLCSTLCTHSGLNTHTHSPNSSHSHKMLEFQKYFIEWDSYYVFRAFFFPSLWSESKTYLFYIETQRKKMIQQQQQCIDSAIVSTFYWAIHISVWYLLWDPQKMWRI